MKIILAIFITLLLLVAVVWHLAGIITSEEKEQKFPIISKHYKEL